MNEHDTQPTMSHFRLAFMNRDAGSGLGALTPWSITYAMYDRPATREDRCYTLRRASNVPIRPLESCYKLCGR